MTRSWAPCGLIVTDAVAMKKLCLSAISDRKGFVAMTMWNSSAKLQMFLLMILKCDSMVGTFLTRAGWRFSMVAFGELLAPRNGTYQMPWFSVVNLVSPKPMEHTIKSPRANELFGSLISNAKEVRQPWGNASTIY